MGKIIGIDLGTTNSCVCVVQEGDCTVIPNAEGSRTTPSVVAFTDDGQRPVGHIAKRQSQTNAENTVAAVKRLIGQRFDSEHVQRAIETSSYAIVENPRGDAWVQVRGREYSPSEISSFILREMKTIAENYLGHEVEQAIVTVPAYFNDAQRQATKDAGRIAGLDVLRIINEPTAAALAYGLDKNYDSVAKVAVYDLGGGTFDVSILELSEGLFSVLSTSGDTFLGGEDFDNIILNWLLGQFEDDYGVDLRTEKMALQRLRDEAERAKCELSSVTSTEIHLPFLYVDNEGPKHLTCTLTRAQYENMAKELVERTIIPCQSALTDAGLDSSDIDSVILVGGMTRMPLIRETVERFFGKRPDTTVNPDEVVAMGAAIQGGIVGGDLTEVVLLDVTPLTLGVETMGGVFTPLIERNTMIPCSYSEIFSTARDHQEMVRVHVLQGERPMAADNKSLAVFELTEIPPAPRGVPKIEVTFDIDENGIVNVHAKDLDTGREQRVNIVADGGLKEEEIEKMIQEAQANQESDVRQKAIAEKRNQALGLLFSTERSLNDFSDELPAADRQQWSRELNIVRDKIEYATEVELIKIIKQLESIAFQLTDAMYGAMDEVTDD